MSEEYAVQVQTVASTAVTVRSAVDALRFRKQVLTEAARDVLKEGIDFGIIPGTGTKPTLLKAGAESLATLFNLHPDPILVDKLEDWDKGLFFYRYRMELRANDGSFICAAEGSANSREKKYRWRKVPDFKATAEEKAAAVKRETLYAKKTNQPFVMLTIENTEPFDLVNTLQKMAQKRALVAAVLSGTGASEFFTQDIEDLDFGYTEPEDIEPVVQPEQHKQATKTDEPKKPKAKPAVTRPGTAAQVRKSLREKAKWIKGQHADWSDATRPPDDQQRPPADDDVQRLAAVMGKGGLDEQQRYSVNLWLWGHRSTTELTAAEVEAALKAWEATDTLPDGTTRPLKFHANEYATPELSACLYAALEMAGQQKLDIPATEPDKAE